MFKDSIKSGISSNKHSWELSSKIGGKFPNIRPLFTKDNQHVVIVTSLHIKIFNLLTKSCIHSYSIDSTDITDISEDINGNIFVSKFNESSLILDQSGINSTNIKLPIIKIIKLTENSLYCILENNGKLEICEIDLNNGESCRVIRSEKSGKLIAFSPGFKYFAIYSSKHGKYEIIVGQLDADWNLVEKEKIIKRNRPLLSLAINDSGLIAAGSESGVIDLYYGDENTLRTLKWHVDSVTALKFSLDGTYLLSGGKERVLVFWQMETGNTQFLPRLDGTIDDIFVSPESQLYGLILSGEQILILSAVDLESRLLVAGVKPHFAKEYNEKEQKRRRKKLLLQQQQQINAGESIGRVPDYTCSYYLHPVTKNAYFPGKNRAQIQIYNINKDEQQQVISVAAAIQTGKVKSETMIEDPVVTQLCFSNDGKWMVTADSRQNPSIETLMSKDDIEINLKFWRLDNGDWNLCTRVSSPHGRNKQISDIVCASQGFLTAAEDGSIRYWGLTEGSKRFTGNKGMDKWSVRKLLNTNNRSSSAVSLTISDDSSVIALGFENNVYIIDGKKFEIRNSLSNLAGSRIRSVKILDNCLIILSKTRLIVWDLLTNSEKWTVGIQSPTNGRRLIDFDPLTKTFCFAYNFYGRDCRIQSKLFFMNLDTPLPIQIESHNTAVSSVKLIPGGGSNFSFIDIKGRINILSCDFGSKINPVKSETDFKQHMLALYSNTTASTVSNRIEHNGTVMQNNILTVASLEPVFENLDLGLETMFESLLDIVSPAVQNS